MTNAIFEITKAATFDAAHYLEQGSAENPYRRLHGHSFKVEASVRGRRRRHAVLGGGSAELDRGTARHRAASWIHGLLNEKPGLETPTLEHIQACISLRRLSPSCFPGLSPNCGCLAPHHRRELRPDAGG